jgi:hypothetical protein
MLTGFQNIKATRSRPSSIDKAIGLQKLDDAAKWRFKGHAEKNLGWCVRGRE